MSDENKKPPKSVSGEIKPLRLVPLHMMRSRENFWKLAVVVLMLVVSYFNYSYYQSTNEKEKMIITRSQPLRALETANIDLAAMTAEQAAELCDYFAKNARGSAPLIKDGKDAFLVKIFIPFLSKYEIDVPVNAGIMTINGKAVAENADKDKNNADACAMSHSFTYTIFLPLDVDVQKIKMTKTANVLTVSIPKKIEKPVEKTVEKTPAKTAAKVPENTVAKTPVKPVLK